MKPLTAADPETKSPDLVAENLSRLRALFPELVTEGPDGVAVNLDVLKQLVGDQTVTEAEEKYGLNWHGKRRARQLALTPSTGTLRPCPADSVDWDTRGDADRWPAFREAIALSRQPRATLHALYQGWIDTLLALQSARVTGAFAVAANAEHAAARRDALQECARLDAEITRLRATAARERQMSRRVELNLELKRVEAAQATARANL